MITLSDIQHLLQELETQDVRDNPDLVMLPKPAMLNKENEFYNIDFSLDYQLLISGAPVAAEWSSQDPVVRKLRLRRASCDQVLRGMRAKKKTKHAVEEEEHKSAKSKKWNEKVDLQRQQLDNSRIFEEEVGQIPGLTCWEIDNFLPNQVEEALIGKFYVGDCYIVLKTFGYKTNASNWSIYFWIGKQASLDKKACSAIHAVYLQNLLGAEGHTIREEMGEESNEFLGLFENGVSYIDGERASSGFCIVEKRTYETKVYRAVGVQSVHMERCPVAVSSLDPRFVYLVDTGLIIYLWDGMKSKEVTKTKSRLIAEKINLNERQGNAEIEVLTQGNETGAFWKTFNVESARIQEWVPDDYEWTEPKLYKVRRGMCYKELPQQEIPDGKLRQSILDTKQVYILDCKTDVFVWIGKKSTRLIRAAALKLSQEITSKTDCRDFCTITRCLEGTEPQIFKTKFVGWDDVLPVDYTRTAESITKRGADMKVIMERDKIKTDLSALFFARQPSMEKGVAKELIENWNVDSMEAFVLENNTFVRLPENELGIFHSEDCYVFLCRYWLPEEEEEEAEKPEDQIKCVVYFWQGRDAGNMGYLTFTFSLQKKFEDLIGDKLKVVRTHQQQENLKFMSHFKGKYVIRNGKRRLPNEEPKKQVCELFELRANGGIISTRCIQIRPHSSLLNSCFCFILMVPFDDKKDLNGIVYIWCGSKADHDDAKMCQDIAHLMYQDNYSDQVINEGEEPENFWAGLGGKKTYETNADFMEFARLFRCSNDKGYFAVFEKADFCQDNLVDDDVMILDNGQNVYLWIGKKTSEVEIKLSFKSAQVYIQHLERKQPERPRKLLLAIKYKEDNNFTKCFHGWGGYNEVKE